MKRFIKSYSTWPPAHDRLVLESYITHVRITEDAAHPSSPPPPNSAAENKKPRVIIIAVRNSGLVRLHKARENADGSFSVGKTWSLSELSAIESFTAASRANQGEEGYAQWAGRVGFIVTIQKPYFWQADTEKEKDYFIASLIKIYRKFTGGKVPRLLGFDTMEVQRMLGTATPEMAGRAATPGSTAITPEPTTTPGIGGTMASSVIPGPAPALTSRQPSREPSQHSLNQSLPEPSPRRAPAVGLGLTSSGHNSIDNLRQGPNGRASEDSVPQGRPSMSSRAGTPRNDHGPDDQRPSQVARSEHAGANGMVGRMGSSEEMPATRRPSVPQSSSLYSAPSTERFQPNRSAQGSPSRNDMSSARSTPTNMQRESQERLREQRPSLSQGLREPSQTANRSPHRDRALRDGTSRSSESVPNVNDSLKLPPRPAKMPLHGERTASPDTVDTSSFVSERSDRATPPLTASTVQTSATPPHAPPFAPPSAPPPTPPPERPREEESYRPGLGPMIKKKSNRDVANTFRKAATAYGAFKPRLGGAGDTIKEQGANTGQEPDGITAVVPAPSLPKVTPRASETDIGPKSAQRDERVMSSQPEKKSIEMERTQSGAQRSAENVAPRQSEELGPRTPSAASGTGPLEAPSKPRPTTAQKAPDPRNARTAQLLSSLNINPSILESSPARNPDAFIDTLAEFSWGVAPTTGADPPRQRPTAESLEAQVRKEIGRVEAGSWLWQLDQRDERVHAVEKLLDQTIAECDALDGLLSLYLAELDVSLGIHFIDSFSSMWKYIWMIRCKSRLHISSIRLNVTAASIRYSLFSRNSPRNLPRCSPFQAFIRFHIISHTSHPEPPLSLTLKKQMKWQWKMLNGMMIRSFRRSRTTSPSSKPKRVVYRPRPSTRNVCGPNCRTGWARNSNNNNHHRNRNRNIDNNHNSNISHISNINRNKNSNINNRHRNGNRKDDDIWASCPSSLSSRGFFLLLFTLTRAP